MRGWSRKKGGARADDLLCSRNAARGMNRMSRLREVLVGRAQLKINQPPPPWRDHGKLGRSIDIARPLRRTSLDGRSRTSTSAIPPEGQRASLEGPLNSNACATRGLRRPSLAVRS